MEKRLEDNPFGDSFDELSIDEQEHIRFAQLLQFVAQLRVHFEEKYGLKFRREAEKEGVLNTGVYVPENGIGFAMRIKECHDIVVITPLGNINVALQTKDRGYTRSELCLSLYFVPTFKRGDSTEGVQQFEGSFEDFALHMERLIQRLTFLKDYLVRNGGLKTEGEEIYSLDGLVFDIVKDAPLKNDETRSEILEATKSTVDAVYALLGKELTNKS